MRNLTPHVVNLRQGIICLVAAILLFYGKQSFAQEIKGQKAEVSSSATVDFKSMEAYEKAHPLDPKDHRIGGFKEGETDGDEEGEAPKLKVPKNAKVIADPFGKMPVLKTEKPSPGNSSSASFSTITTFNGIDDINSVIPPDVGGQVGPNHVMTALNSFVRISNRAGTAISTVSLNAFFSTLGNPSTFDPKVFYDPYNNRWVITACGNAASASSAVLMGISANSDPTGTWKLYSIDVDSANVNWFDYPSIGFNKNWVVVGGNMFTNAANGFAGGKLFVFKKSDLYAGVASPGVTVINAGTNGFTLCPAITYDNTISTMYLTQNFNGNSGGNGFIGFYTITGAFGSEVLSGTTFVSTPNPWASGAPSTNFAPQSGTANKVANNDARMQKTVYRNGSIWCTHSVFLPAAAPTRTAVQWWQLSTAGAVTQRGRIDDATGTNFYAFPCIDVNQNNDAMIGCAKFSASTFPSACYAVRMASDPVNTFQPDVVYKAGQASYFKTFGGASNRWGDYTSVCVDPNNDIDFWTVQEYSRPASGGNDLWGTFWAGVCIPPPTPGIITGVSPVNSGSTGKVFSVAPVSGATSYTWTFPAGCVITGGINTNSVTVTIGSTSGTVSVIANKGTCSSVAQTFALTVNAFAPVTAAPTNNGPLCPGNTLNLLANPAGGLPPYTFNWTGPNGFVSTLQNPSITNVSSINGGSYSVTVKDSQGVPFTATNSTTVIVNAASASTTNLTICPSALPFVWNGITATAAGTFVAHLTNSAGCDSAATLVLSLFPATPVSFTALAPVYNIAAAAVTLTGSPVGGTFSGPGVSGNVFTPSVAATGGPYTISYAIVDSNRCTNTATQQTSVANCPVTATPGVITTVGGAASVCPGSTKTYSIAAVAGATSYTWTPPTGGNITTGQGTTTVTINYTTNFIASGTLKVVANNACGFSAARSLTITRNTALTPGVITGATYGVCKTSGVAYSVVNVAGRTYNWTFNSSNASVATGQGTNAITANFVTGYVTGILSVTASTACGTSAARTITIKATPAAPAAIIGSNSVCANQTGVPYSIAPVTSATNYTWTAPAGSKVSDGVTTSVSTSLTTTSAAVTVNYATTAGNLIARGNNACGAGLSKTLPIAITCKSMAGKAITQVTDTKSLSVTLSPNPSSSQFTLIAHSSKRLPVNVRVIDGNGKVVHVFKGLPEQTFRFGEKLMDGLYLVEVRQGENVKTVEAIKSK